MWFLSLSLDIMDGREQKQKILLSLPIILFFVFYPLIFTPFFTDSYSLPKLLFLTLTTIFTIGLWLWLNNKKRLFQLSLNPFLLVLSALVAVAFASAFIASPNYHISLLVFPIPAILAVILFIGLTSFYNREIIGIAFTSLISSATILALIAFYQYFGVLSTVIHWKPLTSKIWTPVGDPMNLFFFLAIAFIASFVIGWAERHQIKKILYLLSSALILFGGVLTSSLLFTDPKYKLLLLPWKTAWNIALEAIKNSPLLGVGPGMFITAFQRYRGVAYNMTNIWNRQLAVSRNTPFNLATELGLLGFFVWLWLWWLVFKLIRKNWSRSQQSAQGKILSLSLIFAFIYQLFFSASVFVWVILVILIALYVIWLSGSQATNGLKKLIIALEASSRDQSNNQIRTYKSGSAVNIITFIILLGIITYTAFYSSKYALAEYQYALAIRAGWANNGQQLVQHLGKAINDYPWVSRYHLRLAQIHLNVIQNILAKNKKNKKLSDADKKQLQISVKTALGRAKIVASNINPTDANNWLFLAGVYRQLIGLVKGADKWEVASYRQAIALDPVNPIIRTSLAGLLYSLKDYDGAIEQAKLAVQAKSDYANSWYNLALAYEKKGNYQAALTSMNNVLAYLPAKASDRSKVQKEIDALNKKIAAIKKKQQKQQKQQRKQPAQAKPALTPSPTPTPVLQAPTPLPSPSITPVQVPPEQAKPPISPTPTPQK